MPRDKILQDLVGVVSEAMGDCNLNEGIFSDISDCGDVQPSCFGSTPGLIILQKVEFLYDLAFVRFDSFPV